MDKNYNGSKWETKFFGSQHSLKYLLLCSTEQQQQQQQQKTILVWNNMRKNYGRFFIFG